jgi:2-polyprenyl-6-methoxyphenol hydroxylase-like FAD-dependent oxidoreductase
LDKRLLEILTIGQYIDRMTSPTILISGAGIAGPTLAFWLARHGFSPTVVERATAIRSSGSPVDVRGDALEVVRQMGLEATLRAGATAVTEAVFVDEAGRQVGRLPNGGSRDLELPRGDLATVLHEAARHDADFLFGDQLTAIAPDAAGVEVTFERSRPRRFDAVIGADGLHSAVRRLAFGAEHDFVEHLGIYVATVPFPRAGVPAHQVQLYNTPNRLVSLHPGRGQALAALMFRSAAIAGFDPHDVGGNKRILAAAFAGTGWRTPELLDEVATSDAFYFDSVSRVSLPRWSNGRVAVLGDAASCVSLFGDGSTLAIIGAHTLAKAMAASPGDLPAAFAQYERTHRLVVEPRMAGMERGARVLIPTTSFGIAARNAASCLAPLAAWAQRTFTSPPAVGAP